MLFTLFPHDILDIIWADWKAVGAQMAGSIGRDEDVVFQADATKIVVVLQFGVVYEVKAQAFLFELFYEGGVK